MSPHDDDHHQDQRPPSPLDFLRALTKPAQSRDVKIAEDRSDAGAGIIHPTGADDDKPSDRRPTAAPTNYDPNPSGRPDDPLSVKMIPDVLKVKPEGHVPTREVPADTWTLQVLSLTADRVQMIAPENVDRVSVEIFNTDGAGGIILLGDDPDVLLASTPPGRYFPLTQGSSVIFHHTAAIFARSYTGTVAGVLSTELRQSDRT